MRPSPQPPKMPGGTKRGKDLWAGAQSKLMPVSAFRMNFHSSQRSKDTRKGPAFWSDSTGARPKPRADTFVPQPQSKSQPQPQSKWEIQDKVSTPLSFPGIVTWWKICALVLLTTALIMFSILMSLIRIYMREADKITAIIPHLQRWEKRLQEAIKQQVGSTVLTCKPCKDNWLQWSDSCYQGTSEAMAWNRCIEHCQKFGASLLIGRTSGEMKFLMLETHKWLAKKNIWSISDGYWIGLMYNVTQQNWHWADGAILHLKLDMTEKNFPPFLHVCILFADGKTITKDCSAMNYCLCKRSV